jgi:hypothetical protein
MCCRAHVALTRVRAVFAANVSAVEARTAAVIISDSTDDQLINMASKPSTASSQTVSNRLLNPFAALGGENAGAMADPFASLFGGPGGLGGSGGLEGGDIFSKMMQDIMNMSLGADGMRPGLPGLPGMHGMQGMPPGMGPLGGFGNLGGMPGMPGIGDNPFMGPDGQLPFSGEKVLA